MKVDLSDVSATKKTMVVEVEPAEVERETEQVLRKWRQQVRLPGFRPGHAPLSLIRTRFAREVEEDVRERVVSRSYLEATRERGLRPIGDPVLEEVEHAEGEPLRFKTTFEVLPEIALRNHEGLEVRRPKVELAETEVDQLLEELRQSRARLVTDSERVAEKGDVVVASGVGRPEDGEELRDESMFIELGRPGLIPGFEEALTGVRAGDVREFDVDFPAEAQAKELAGKKVHYRVEVREVKRREIPELDDELARDLGDFEDLEALRARIRQDLQARKGQEADEQVRQAILNKLLLENPIVLPEGLVDAEVRHRLEDLVRSLILRGMDPEKIDVDWADLRKRQEEPARKSVHARLLLDALARERGLQVGEAEVRAWIESQAAASGQSASAVRASLEKDSRLQVLRTQLLREKTLDYLTSVANIHVEE